MTAVERKEEREQRAIALYSEGLTLREVGARLGCSLNTARVLIIGAVRRQRAVETLAQKPDDLEALMAIGRLRRRAGYAIIQ